MRIETTEERDRLWENLCEVTDENARSEALDRAARYYLRMCGGVAAYGRGDIQTLLDEADALRSMVNRVLYDQERLDADLYGQRNQSETVNSSLKRKYGAFVRSRHWWKQFRELSIACIIHNVDRSL